MINLWFEHSQEEIARTMGLSLGKVNSIIQQYCIKEEPVARVRDMVISASKNGIDLNQLISNLRYENAVKKFGSDHDKFKFLLKGLDRIFEKNESNPETAAELIYQIAEIVYKEQKSPLEIRDNLSSKIEQDRILEDKIKNNELKLKSNYITTEELELIKYLNNNLSAYDVSELYKIINFINNIRATEYDPAKLIEFASNHFSISQALETVKKKKIEELAYLADTERESSLKRKADQTYQKLFKKGYSEQGIADFLEVVDDLVQEIKSTPNDGNGFIGQLRNDLTTYGSLSVANISLQYQNNELAFSILQSKKMSPHYHTK